MASSKKLDESAYVDASVIYSEMFEAIYEESGYTTPEDLTTRRACHVLVNYLISADTALGAAYWKKVKRKFDIL